MRGERGPAARPATWIAGSSPHARGTPRTPTRRAPWRRFIPACAGNATASVSTTATVSVHPRMRGERIVPAADNPVARGSSPHARGTLKLRRLARALRRFIPACAGNAVEDRRAERPPPVHPRMRGERVIQLADGRLLIGSSPHARGTHPALDLDLEGHRFIPACAGNALPISY